MPARRSITAPRARPAPQSAPSADPTPTRKPGRPRSEDRCLAIRDATLELLVDNGFADLTIESIAARAGVGKATVYRRWPCKADLVVHAFFETVAPGMRIGDSGDIRADFRQQMRVIVREMAGPNGRVLATLLACMQMDPTLGESFRTRWLAVRRAEGRMAIERGVERGELPPGTDPTFVLDALYSPLHFRLLAGHEPLTTEFSDRLVELVFDGLQKKDARRAARKTPTRAAAKRKRGS